MPRKLFAEFIGTAMLLIGVVGSGIMAQNLAGDNVALALLANAIATGCMLYAIITTLGPVSGAHFNPVVTLFFAVRGTHGMSESVGYIVVQILGAIIGVWLCHLMFDLPVLQSAATHRTGTHLWISEVIATFGLLFVIYGGLRSRPDAVPTLVGLYITGAYWFTSSTSFANPAVTIGRGFSDTFAGILPQHIPMFILMQVIGTIIALTILPRLFSND